jgi:hypothetical protein
MSDRRIFLVLDSDRDVLDVCESRETADQIAKACDAAVEAWPITQSAHERAWGRALDIARSLRRSQSDDSQT